MISTLDKAQPSESVIEEMCCIELELQTVHIGITKLQARQAWLELLRQNFLKRFGDPCG